MERLTQSLDREYPPVRLNVDTLKQIEAIASSSASNVSILAGEYKFDSVDELYREMKGKVLTTLTLKASSPYLSVEFHRAWTRLHVGSDDPVASGVYFKIDYLLRRCVRHFSWLYRAELQWLPGLVPAAIMSWNRTAGFISVVPLAAWLIWFWRVRLYRYSTIVMTDRSQALPFLQRNKDQLALAVVSALLGAGLGVAGTLLTRWLLK
jgi:hypothetical protein